MCFSGARSVCEAFDVLGDLDNVGVTEAGCLSFTLCKLFLWRLLPVAGLFFLLVEVFWCLSNSSRTHLLGVNSTSKGCRRTIWFLVSSWQCRPVCRQHQGRDGSIVVASEVRFSWFSWHSGQNQRKLGVCQWYGPLCNPSKRSWERTGSANSSILSLRQSSAREPGRTTTDAVGDETWRLRKTHWQAVGTLLSPSFPCLAVASERSCLLYHPFAHLVIAPKAHSRLL